MSAETLRLSLSPVDENLYTKETVEKVFEKFESLDDTQKALQDLSELKYHLEFLQFLEQNQQVTVTQRKELIAYIAQLENSIQLRINNLAKKHRISLEISEEQTEFEAPKALFKTKTKKTAEYTLINALAQLQSSFTAIQKKAGSSTTIEEIATAKTRNNRIGSDLGINLKPAQENIADLYEKNKQTILANPEQFKNYHGYLNNLLTITTQRIELLEKKKEQLGTVSWFSDKNFIGRRLNKLGSWIAQRRHKTELKVLEQQITLQRENQTQIKNTHDIIYKDGLAKHKAAFIASVNELKQDGYFYELESTFTALQQMASPTDLTKIITEVVNGCKFTPASVRADTLYKNPAQLVYLQKLLNFLAEKNNDPGIKTTISNLNNDIHSIINKAHEKFNELVLSTKAEGFTIIECIKNPKHTLFIKDKLEQNEYRQFRLFLRTAEKFNINLAKTESGEKLAVELSNFFAAEDAAINTALYQRLEIEKALNGKSGSRNIASLVVESLVKHGDKTLFDVTFEYFDHLPVADTIRKMVESYVNRLNPDARTSLYANHFMLIDHFASEQAKSQLQKKVNQAATTLVNLDSLPPQEVYKYLFFLEQFKNSRYLPQYFNNSPTHFLLEKLQQLIFSSTPDNTQLDKAALILANLLTSSESDSFIRKPIKNLFKTQNAALEQFIKNLASGQPNNIGIHSLCQFKRFIMNEARHHEPLKPYANRFKELTTQLNEQIETAITNYQFEHLNKLEADLRQFLPNTAAPKQNRGYVGHLLSEKIRADLVTLATKANQVQGQDNLTEYKLDFIARLCAELLPKAASKTQYPQAAEIGSSVTQIAKTITHLLKNDKAGVFSQPELLSLRLQFMASLHRMKLANEQYELVTKALLTCIRDCNSEQLLTLQKNVPALYLSVHEAIETKQKELAEPNKQISQLLAQMNSKFTKLEEGSEQHFTNGINYLIYGEGKFWDRLTQANKIESNNAAVFLDDVIMPICDYLDDIEQEAEKNPHLAKQHAQVSAEMNAAITTIGEKLIEDFQALSGKQAGDQDFELVDNNTIAPKAPGSYDIFLQRFAFFTKMRDKFDHGDNENRKVLGQQVMQQFNKAAKTQPVFVTQFISNMDGSVLKNFAPLLLADEQYIDNLTKNDNLIPMITSEGIQYVDPYTSSKKSGLLLEDQKAGTNELPATTFVRMLSHVVLADIYNLKNLSHQQKNLLKEQFEFLIGKLRLEERQNSVRAEHLQNNDDFRLNLANNLKKYVDYCRKLVTLIGQRSNNPQADKEIIAKAMTTKSIPKEATADQTALIEATFMLERCDPMVNQLKQGAVVFDQGLLNALIKDLPGQFITWLETPEPTQEETAKLSPMALQEQALLPTFTAMERSLASQIRALKELLSVKDHFAKVLNKIIEQSADDISGDLKNLLHGQHIKDIAALLKFDLVELAQKTGQSLAKAITSSRETKVQEEFGTAPNSSFMQAHFATQKPSQADLVINIDRTESTEPEEMDLATLNAKRQTLEKQWNDLLRELLPTHLGEPPIPAFELTEDVKANSHLFAATSLKEGLAKAEKQLAEIKNHQAKHPIERLKIVAFLNCLQDKHIVKVIRDTKTPTYAYIHSAPLSNTKPDSSSTKKMFSTFARSAEKIDTQQEQALIQLTDLYSQGLYTIDAVETLMEQLITANNKPELQAIKDNEPGAIVANLTLEQQKEYYAEFNRIFNLATTISESTHAPAMACFTEEQVRTNNGAIDHAIGQAKTLIAATEKVIFGYFSKTLISHDYVSKIKEQATLLRRTLDGKSTLTEEEDKYFQYLKNKFYLERDSTHQKRQDCVQLYVAILDIKQSIQESDQIDDAVSVIEQKCATLVTRIKGTRDNIKDKNSSFKASLNELVKLLQTPAENKNGLDFKP